MNSETDKEIADLCCGGKMMWFDKDNKDVLFCDIRQEEKGYIQYCPNWECNPDIIADYKDLPFEDNKFKLIAWDIPHIIKNGTGLISKKYGYLGENWSNELSKGFDEVWRVLDHHGTLIFKWSDINIPLKEVLGRFSEKPLFGTRTKKGVSNTFFIVFFKK
tara:strand:+ start:65 stop:547 length:483 start_codon:yes stop_codon:yes gene_type:complete